MEAFRKPAPGGLFIIKGSYTVDKSIPEIVAFISDLPRKANYDELYETGHYIERFDDTTEVVYLKYKRQAIVSPRDFCLFQKRFELSEDRVIAVAFSVDHPDCPQTKFVRANLYMGCMILDKVNDSQTYVTYMVHVDVGGSVPTSIVNSAQQKQSLVPFKIATSLK